MSGSSVVKCTLYSDVIGLVLSVFGIHLLAFFSAFHMSFIAVYTVSLLDMQENSLFSFSGCNNCLNVDAEEVV